MTPARRIVLTRQRESNREWAARLTAAGHAVLDLPLLRFEPIRPQFEVEPERFDWILFTSPQGVRAFAAAGYRPGRAQIATLGAGTRAALAEYGWKDAFGADCVDGVELAARFAGKVYPPASLLMPGPERRMTAPIENLEGAGFEVLELPLYRTLPISKSELPDAPFAADDTVFFCSPSTVHAFTAAWDTRPSCVAIGETTAAAAREAGFEPAVAATPDLNAMVVACGLDPLTEPVPPERES